MEKSKELAVNQQYVDKLKKIKQYRDKVEQEREEMKFYNQEKL